MIRVNLLKPEHKEIKEAADASDLAVPKKKKEPVKGLIIFLLVVSLFSYFYTQERRLKKERNLMDAATEERNTLQDVATILSQQEAKKDTLEKKIEQNIRKAFPGTEMAVEWKRSRLVRRLDTIALQSDQTRKDRPGYRVPQVKGLYLVGGSTCAPGSSWEMEYESVLECFDRVKGERN